ncbi:MAG TPA: hypothetical protein VJB08_04790 [Candidatus Nanoarchaeia archaeon]|nr:hypothetical protein [Candidatus Nanoarchaeia archaeon]
MVECMPVIDLSDKIQDGSLEKSIVRMAPKPDSPRFKTEVDYFLAALESYKTMAESQGVRGIGDRLLELSNFYRQHHKYDGAKQVEEKIAYWIIQDILAA